MTLLGFQERFVPNVEAGYWAWRGKPVDGAIPKRHSIRRVPKDGKVRFKVGDQVQLYRRARQKDMRKIVDVDPVCVKIEAILISMEADGRVLIDHGKGYWEDQEPHAIELLARADGFDSVGAFFDFFTKPGDHFRGHIIHWDWK